MASPDAPRSKSGDSELGPRSPAPATFFEVRCAGLFETHVADRLSATMTTCEHDLELRILARRRPQPSSRSRATQHPERCGDTLRAARSRSVHPVVVLSRLREVATPMRRERVALAARCAEKWTRRRMTCGSKDRAKDGSPRGGKASRMGACAWRDADQRSPPRHSFGLPWSSVRCDRLEEPTPPLGPTKTAARAALREEHDLPDGLGAFHRRRSRTDPGIASEAVRSGLPPTPLARQGRVE